MKITAAILISSLAVLSLGGTAHADNSDKNDEHKVWVCHKVQGEGELKNGYNLIEVDLNSTNGPDHLQHEGDIIDVDPSLLCGGATTSTSSPDTTSTSTTTVPVTTTEPSTTTSLVTTTTVTESTSTSSSTTPSSSSSLPQSPPSTDAPPATTEPSTPSSVAVDIPPVPSTEPTVPAATTTVTTVDQTTTNQALPKTGVNTGEMIALAVILVIVGIGVVQATRRKR